MLFDGICFNEGKEYWETLLDIHGYLIPDRKNANNLHLFSRFGQIHIISSHNHLLCSRNTSRFHLRRRLLYNQTLEISVNRFVLFHQKRACGLARPATSKLNRLLFMKIVRTLGLSAFEAFVDCFLQLVEHFRPDCDHTLDSDQLSQVLHLQFRNPINEWQIKKFDRYLRHDIFEVRGQFAKQGEKECIQLRQQVLGL